jgi:hypothetical protein
MRRIAEVAGDLRRLVARLPPEHWMRGGSGEAYQAAIGFVIDSISWRTHRCPLPCPRPADHDGRGGA